MLSWLSTICKSLNIQGKKTHHSFRQTLATLFQNGIDKQFIQDATGHHSLSELHQYKNISTEQHVVLTNIITNNIGKSEENVSMQEKIIEPEKFSLQTFISHPIPPFAPQQTINYQQCTFITVSAGYLTASEVSFILFYGFSTLTKEQRK
jgi:hypothetical protein